MSQRFTDLSSMLVIASLTRCLLCPPPVSFVYISFQTQQVQQSMTNSEEVKNLEGGCKERAKYAASYAFFLNESCETTSLYSGMENK